MNNVLYTIGYAGKSIESFVSCLKKHGVTCLIDVRSMPFSKAFPMFDKNSLKETLKKGNIVYAHFGPEFGARRDEKEAYNKVYSLKGELLDQVSFNNVYSLPLFQRGIERVYKAIDQGYKICFMCSEKHPVDCHRFWMVAYYFASLSSPFEIINIIDENTTQTFEETIKESSFEKEKNKFYKEHDELSGMSLVQLEVPAWVKQWDDLFSSAESELREKQIFSNIKIGYVKGGEEDD